MAHDTGPRMRVVAIDGPVASGKTVIGKAVAERLRWPMLDTGIMYRALTWAAIQRGLLPDPAAADPAALVRLADEVELRVGARAAGSPETASIAVDGADATPHLRSKAVEDAVSVSGERARRPRADGGAAARDGAPRSKVVMVGRDIGTVVAQEALVKIYLHASDEVRAARRAAQMRASGRSVTDAEVLTDLQTPRRHRPEPRHRAVAPRRRAPRTWTPAATIWRPRSSGCWRSCGARWANPPLRPGGRYEPVGRQLGRGWRCRCGCGARPPGCSSTSQLALRRVGLPGMPTGSRVWYLFSCGIAHLFFRTWTRWERVGLEHLPKSGGVILVSNHLASADPPMLAAAMYPRWPKFMGKVELFQKGFIGYLFAMCGTFPVRRFEADLGALREAERLLARGEIVAILPEGHRSDTAAMNEAYPGRGADRAAQRRAGGAGRDHGQPGAAKAAGASSSSARGCGW